MLNNLIGKNLFHTATARFFARATKTERIKKPVSSVGNQSFLIKEAMKSKVNLKEANMQEKNSFDNLKKSDNDNKNSISNISFDEFTQKISDSELSIDSLEHTRIKQELGNVYLDEKIRERLITQLDAIKSRKLEDFEVDLPWSFNLSRDLGKKEPLAESSLDSIVPIERILSLQKMQTLMKNFFFGQGEGDFTELERILERRFYTNLKKKISYLNDKGFQLAFKHSQPKILEVDVYNVKNFFTVGCEQNRKRNRLAKSYLFREDVIAGQLMNFIIDKAADDKSKVKVYIQYHLNVFTDMSLNLVDKKTKEIVFQDDYEILFEGLKRIDEEDGLSSSHESQLKKSVVHNVIIEAEALEGNYQSLKKIVRNSKNPHEVESGIKDFKSKFAKLEWKIIDFDGFMNENPLVSEYYTTLY